ncbi:MAG: endonuclease III domain-containing protein [Nanobdellota archaeon]
MTQIQKIYNDLIMKYGPQGWWPLLDVKGSNPTKTGNIRGYHPGDYSYPKNEKQRFEICIGAILTQNTSWINVEKALLQLKDINCLSPKNMKNIDEKDLCDAIKPAGYFNQKAKKLKIFTEFFTNLKKEPPRDELLSLWGVGPETADSILLYAYKIPVFVVDTYTKRLFSRKAIIKKNDKYEDIRKLFEKSLKKDYRIYQEYHALIVEEEKPTKSVRS